MGTYDPGVIIFQGGGPFEAHDEIDAGVLARQRSDDGRRVADGRCDGEALACWSRPLGRGRSASAGLRSTTSWCCSAPRRPTPRRRLRAAGAVWVVGDSPMHLRSVLKDTPIVEALRHHADEGVLVAVGACAAAMCDPMTDPRGGAFTLGLGLVAGLALVTESETLTAERLNRTRELAAEHGDACLAVMPSGSALTRDDTGWTVHGDVDARRRLAVILRARRPFGSPRAACASSLRASLGS
ncbi:MAG: hypothetical protein WKF58_03105 [Ilumatobacteraceae bacterium]